jgi:hypothetical protein
VADAGDLAAQSTFIHEMAEPAPTVRVEVAVPLLTFLFNAGVAASCAVVPSQRSHIIECSCADPPATVETVTVQAEPPAVTCPVHM